MRSKVRQGEDPRRIEGIPAKQNRQESLTLDFETVSTPSLSHNMLLAGLFPRWGLKVRIQWEPSDPLGISTYVLVDHGLASDRSLDPTSG